MVKPTSKHCSKCDETFPALAFFNNKARYDGLSVYCKPCFTVSLKTPGYREKLRALGKRWYEKHKNVLSIKRAAQYQVERVERRVKYREFYGRNKEAISENSRRSRLKIRVEVLQHYGGFCQCCGETRYEFLAIDHVNGGGNKERRQHRYKCGNHFYNWLRKNDYPDGFQVLCHNCNMAKGFYGQCPHVVELLLEDECQSLA